MSCSTVRTSERHWPALVGRFEYTSTNCTVKLVCFPLNWRNVKINILKNSYILTLSTDEFLSLFVANYKVGVDVVRTRNAVYLGQTNSSLIISFDVRISVLVQVLPCFWSTRRSVRESVRKQLQHSILSLSWSTLKLQSTIIILP